jgi:hypothetical protein
MRGHPSIRARSATESSRGRPAKRTGSKPTKIIGLPTDPFSSHTLATRSFLLFHPSSNPSTHFHTRNARWYDPLVGRFVGRDVDLWMTGFGYSGCSSCQSDIEDVPSPYTVRWHKYRYTANNPTNYADYDGLSLIHPGKPVVWKCKRRLDKSNECCTAQNTVRYMYPFFGHCFLKTKPGDRGKGWYPGSTIDDERESSFPSTWCRPTTADPDCVDKELANYNGEYNKVTNNCCIVVNRIIRKCNPIPLF